MATRLVQIAMNAQDDSALGRFWGNGAEGAPEFLTRCRIRPPAFVEKAEGVRRGHPAKEET
jgi:hypothetical protein